MRLATGRLFEPESTAGKVRRLSRRAVVVGIGGGVAVGVAAATVALWPDPPFEVNITGLTLTNPMATLKQIYLEELGLGQDTTADDIREQATKAGMATDFEDDNDLRSTGFVFYLQLSTKGIGQDLPIRWTLYDATVGQPIPARYGMYINQPGFPRDTIRPERSQGDQASPSLWVRHPLRPGPFYLLVEILDEVGDQPSANRMPVTSATSTPVPFP